MRTNIYLNNVLFTQSMFHLAILQSAAAYECVCNGHLRGPSSPCQGPVCPVSRVPGVQRALRARGSLGRANQVSTAPAARVPCVPGSFSSMREGVRHRRRNGESHAVGSPTYLSCAVRGHGRAHTEFLTCNHFKMPTATASTTSRSTEQKKGTISH